MTVSSMCWMSIIASAMDWDLRDSESANSAAEMRTSRAWVVPMPGTQATMRLIVMSSSSVGSSVTFFSMISRGSKASRTSLRETRVPALLARQRRKISKDCETRVSASAPMFPFTSVYTSMMMASNMFSITKFINHMKNQNQIIASNLPTSLIRSQSKSPSRIRKVVFNARPKFANSKSSCPKRITADVVKMRKTVPKTTPKWSTSVLALLMVCVTSARRGCAEKALKKRKSKAKG
mmetsp:Transcript_121089/g.270684  ORF Transcript_121089/g.270684 Transcript_121089/m.270684 type:complete len:236 (+) Transcript_121089:471-1178(+)